MYANVAPAVDPVRSGWLKSSLPNCPVFGAASERAFCEQLDVQPPASEMVSWRRAMNLIDAEASFDATMLHQEDRELVFLLKPLVRRARLCSREVRVPVKRGIAGWACCRTKQALHGPRRLQRTLIEAASQPKRSGFRTKSRDVGPAPDAGPDADPGTTPRSTFRGEALSVARPAGPIRALRRPRRPSQWKMPDATRR